MKEQSASIAATENVVMEKKQPAWTPEQLVVLSDRERRVIQLRYGLLDGYARTLREVAMRFGVTGERIRQIEARAIKKLPPRRQA